MVVALEGDKDFSQNAKLCFKQARKIRRAHEQLAPLIAEVNASLEQWESHAAELVFVDDSVTPGGNELVAQGVLDSAAAETVLQLREELIEEGIIKRLEVLE